jgi:hypothetical protein
MADHAELLHDDAKTIATLGAAVLGISATLLKDVVGSGYQGRAWIIASWVFLVVSIAVAIFSSAQTANNVKDGNPTSKAASYLLGFSFYLLLFGVVLLATGAYFGSRPPGAASLSDAIVLADTALAGAKHVDQSQLDIQSFHRNAETDLTFVILDHADRKTYKVVIDLHSREVRQLSRIIHR